jgi:hypothetical protein
LLNAFHRFFHDFMKKSSRRDHPSESAVAQGSLANRKDEGRWEFTGSGRLFPMGATDSVRRAAYWTAGGELRFFPL